jgi:hypothetical protein
MPTIYRVLGIFFALVDWCGKIKWVGLEYSAYLQRRLFSLFWVLLDYIVRGDWIERIEDSWCLEFCWI